jgi:hypothetical protein
MKPVEYLEFASRDEWRLWLTENSGKRKKSLAFHSKKRFPWETAISRKSCQG